MLVENLTSNHIQFSWSNKSIRGKFTEELPDYLRENKEIQTALRHGLIRIVEIEYVEESDHMGGHYRVAVGKKSPPTCCEGCGETIPTGNRFCSFGCQHSVLNMRYPEGCSCHNHPPCSRCVETDPDLPRLHPEMQALVLEVLRLTRHKEVPVAGDLLEP
jgi:hypothetical protein